MMFEAKLEYYAPGVQKVVPKTKSRGFGDTVEKFTKATGIKAVVDKVAEITGVEDCGCEKRKKLLNDLIPYKN